jgi:hypothetical protein
VELLEKRNNDTVNYLIDAFVDRVDIDKEKLFIEVDEE